MSDDLKKLIEQCTPGPWRLRTLENFGWNVVHYRNEDKFDILRVAKASEETNARLIAMAPDLARRVIAAEALVDVIQNDRGWDAMWAAITAFEETKP